jgi:hypothetical protein
MPACDLRIELLSADGLFRGGDVVEGQVVVEVDSAVRCDKLTIELLWRVHGYGNRVERSCEKEVLFSGDWREGSPHRYRFSLTLPGGPLTFHGTLVNVAWLLRARADVPWAIDPKAESDLVVEKGALPALASGTTLPNRGDWSKLIGSAFLVLSLPLWGMGLFEGGRLLLADDPEGFVFVGFALFPLLLLLWAFRRPLRRFVASQKFGRFKTVLSSECLSAGEPFTVAVRFKARSDLIINHLEVGLHGTEVATSGSGTNSSTRRHTFYEETFPVVGSRRIRGGHLVSERVSITAPDLAAVPMSLEVRDNAIRWKITVGVDIQDWPDYEQDTVVLLGD